MKEERTYRGYVTTLLEGRCPRCREGKLFIHPVSIRLKKNTDMHERCPVCKQVTDIEVGFYYGTGYLSYMIALLITGISFLAWFLVIGFSFSDKRFVYWIISNSIFLLALQPWLMRFSRIFWLSFFIKYDKDWKKNDPDDPEKIVKEHMNNW
jgi:uncharacterized protein (DUF983 family)